MSPVLEDRLAVLQSRPLLAGAHPEHEGYCVMEAVAWVAGERWTDEPACACPVIGAFLRAWNDGIPNDAHRTELLRPLVLRLVGSKSTPDVELKRSYLAFDWLARAQTPAWLDLTPTLKSHADALRALAPLVDRVTVNAASEALSAARAAARAAAWAAAGDAAWAAVRDAAGAAARDAAGRARLAPTVAQLEQSALDLVDRMLAVTA